MMKNTPTIFLLSFLMVVALCFGQENPALRGKKLRGWCVADTGAPHDKLQEFLDYGCHEFDCSQILPGGPCYEPNLLLAHGSWILDKFYRTGAFCKEGLGFITDTNPSYGDCQYP
ncbi:hypothetical protein ABFS83_02G086300 [Erythranthe nasuta]